MSITALVKQYVTLSGDQESELIYATNDLEDSPATTEVVTLLATDNTIEVPDVEGFTIHGVVIVPPTANDIEIVLKGSSGDVGVTLSAVNVSVFQFGSTPPASIVLTVDEELVGLRLVWF